MYVLENLVNHLFYLFNNQIIKKIDYNSGLEKIKICDNTTDKITKDKLVKKLIMEFGYSNINFIYDQFCDKKKSVTFILLMQFLTNAFVIFSVNIIKDEKEVKDIKELATNLGQNCEQFIINNSYPHITDSLYEKLFGGNIYIPNSKGKSFVKLSGIFKQDNFNELKKHKLWYEKYEKIINLLNTKSENDFKYQYFTQLPLVKYLTQSPDQIINTINNEYNEMLKITSLTTNDLLNLVNKSSIIKQRNIIIYLILSENTKNILLANIICDIITDHYYTMGSYELINNFFGSIHWTLTNKLRNINYNNYSELEKLKKIDIDEIDYEHQILLMPVSDEIKKKALVKLKETRSNKEFSNKAQNFLDGLLQIPFGIYKKHELLTFLNTFKTELNKIFDRNLQTELQIDDFLNYSGNFNKNFSSDSLHKLIMSPMVINSPISDVSPSPSIEVVENKMFKIIKSNLERKNINKNIISKYFPEDVSAGTSDISDDNNSPISGPIDLDIKQTDLLKRWNEYKTNKILYLKNVQKILDSCVYGHVKSKEMVQKILAQWMNGQMKGNVLGMYGPPGIGKTTIIKNGLSKCLNECPFEFLALGGKTHGNLLEGSNYTYVGSTWGKIVEMLIHAKCMNPIIYFDELDKISKSENGREIINILIHLTDPAQNEEFQDRYFSGIPLDLSKVLFVFSYNNRDEIDRVLLDRITEIEVEALNFKEKIVICNDYILPEVLVETGYTSDDILFDTPVIEHIIDTYTYESGVRKLKECIIDIIRDINLKRTRGDLKKEHFPFSISVEFVDEIFKNNQKAIYRKISQLPAIGVINGLFANSRGQGGIITIECNKVIHNSKLGLELTGMQGDVMQESMKVARTVAWSLLDKTEKEAIEKDWVNSVWGLHIHCPEGATPKQGPSAGGAITIAILSCLKQLPINNEVAITGEIELHGKITQIGGLQYKLNGAEKAGVKTVLIPDSNADDLLKFRERFPESKLNIVLINNIEEAIPYFLSSKTSVS